MLCLFLNGAHASAKRKLWRYFLRQTFYTDEGVIPETADNFTLKFGPQNIHFLVLIISYGCGKGIVKILLYLRDLVLEILRFSWYFGRCSWFSGGVPGFLGLFRVFWGVPGFLGECSGFSGGVPGFLGVPGCFGVPGSTTCRS